MTRTVTILGGTGTIGDNMLELLRHHSKSAFLYGLSAFNNHEKIIQIIHEFSPKIVAIPHMPEDSDLADICTQKQIELLVGEGAIEELAGRQVDLVVGAIVGMAGLAKRAANRSVRQSVRYSAHLQKPSLCVLTQENLPLAKNHLFVAPNRASHYPNKQNCESLLVEKPRPRLHPLRGRPHQY